MALVALAALGTACTAQQPAESPRPSASEAIPSESVIGAAARPPTGVDYRAMKQRLAKEIESGPESLQEVRAVLVAVDGRTELEFYQDRKPTEQAHVWSVTKSVLSILVGMAIDDGRLQLDQKLSELLPEHVASMTADQQGVRLRQLLTMTGGMAADDGGLNLQADDPIGLMLTYGAVGEIGPFLYSNSSAHLVAAVLHRAIDRPILDYAREKLFDPLGITTRPAWEGSDQYDDDGFDEAGFAWMVDSTGVHSGGYGLRLTAADLVKIGQLYLDGGRWQGRQLVSESWVRESTSNQLTADQAGGERYGYLWWIVEEPNLSAYMAAGSWYQRILVVPTRRLVIVVTADDSTYAESVVPADFEPILAETVVEPLLT